MTLATPTILAFLAIGTPGVAGSRASVPLSRAVDRVEERCDSGTGAEAIICFQAETAKSRRQMERAFERDLRAATAFDKEFNAFARARRMPASHLAVQLKASQAAWLSYSRSQCSLEGGTSAGGSGTASLDAACHYRLNLQRLSDLQEGWRLLNRGKH